MLVRRSVLLSICASVVLVLIPHVSKAQAGPSPKIAPRLLSETAQGNASEALIFLSEKADLTASAKMTSKRARGAYVFQTLRAVADRTQAPIRKLLEERGISYQSFFIVNMIKVTADRKLIDELAAHNEVASIEANPLVRNKLPAPSGFDSGLQKPTIEWNIAAVKAPAVWALGYHGEGLVVAGADTGVKWDHPSLKSHYRGWNGTTVNHDYNWHDSTVDQWLSPSDPNGHGTFTVSEMVGDDGVGNQVGVAPGAKWIACRNMDRNGDGKPSQYIECFQFFMAPYPMGHPELANPALAPNVINNSWDCPASEGCTVNTLLDTVNAVRAAGIFPVMAAGNSGPNCSTVSNAPAIYASAVSVGATDSYTNSITMYSSRGPVTADGSGRLKPDISAPGDNIRAAVPYNNGYQGYWSGTSMAAPHVAGGVALIWQAKPSLKGNVDATEALLQQAATPSKSTQNCGGSGQNVPNNDYGFGFLNLLSAVQSTTTYGISGSLNGVGGAGATVNLTGSATETVTADATGNYSFPGLANGSYTVTPTASGVTFTPASQTVTLNGASITGLNFTGVATQPRTLSGNISGPGGPGATVTLTGTQTLQTTADSSGNYSFTGLLDGSYVVTPPLSGFVYSPASQSVTLNGADNTGVNFSSQNCGCSSIWPASTPPPSLVDSGDGQSIEVGVKFRSDTPGYIVGLRFYKSPPNTGTHIGNLWTSAGALLGTATFTAETGTGWQQVMFSQPVAVNNGPTYVASYFAPLGHYSENGSYFATRGVDNPPLHALAEGVNGSDGVYRYGSASGFPTSSYQSTNYWVDVIYAGTQTYSITGNISGPGGPGATVNLTGSATATASADGLGNYTFSGLANGSYNVTPSNGNYVFTPSTQSVTVNSKHALGVNFSSASPTYTISGTISGAGGPGATLALTGTMTGTTTADGSGNYSFSGVMNGSYTVTPSNGGFTFTPPNQSVTVAGANVPAVNFSTSVITYSISGTISGSGGAGATVALTGSTTATTTADANGNFSFGGISNGSYTVTPSNSDYIMIPVSQAVVVNGGSVSGVNFTVPQNCPCSTVWPLSATPSVIDSADNNPIELGVRIRADFDGYITGVRYYKSVANTGTHTGNVWSNTGTLLGTANFVGESSSGWQQIIFGSPIPVTANTTYVVSYFAPAGNWSTDSNYFSASGTNNPPLHALQNGIDGANGVFTYSSTSTFPTSSNQSSNYWVDVVYANPQTYSITGTISGPGGPQATVSLSGTSTATTTADASGNFSFSGLANGTYTITPTNGNSTFTPATQAVTINHGHALGIAFSSVVSKTSQTINFGALSGQTYGASPITLNATASSGLTVTFTVISGPATVAGNILTITGAGSVTVEADQAGNSQYLAAPPVQQSFTVNKAMLTVTAANASAVYGGVIPAFTYTATGFVNGDTQSVLSGLPSLTSSGVQGSPVGTYTITAAQGTLTAANYAFTFVNGVLTISRAVLTVTANSPSMSYGSTVPTLTYNVTGFVNGDTISVLSGNPSLSTTATSKSPAGAYPVTISAGTLAAANYTFNFVAGTLTVTKAPLTVTANNATTAYGNTIPTLTYTITGFMNGDTQSVLTGAPAETTTATKGSAAGAYPITISAGTLSAANYTFVFASGTLTITQRVLTVTAGNATTIYGGALPTFTYSVTGFVNGDTQSVVSGAPSFSTVAQQGSPAGTYPINITTGTLSAANYTFTFVAGTLTINKAVLTASAKRFLVPYGSSFSLTYTLTGFVNGDTQSVVSGAPTLSTTAQQGSQTGSYPVNITAGTLTAANYSFKFVAGMVIITKATLTVTANRATAIYNQALPTLTYSITGFVNGDTQSVVSGTPIEATTAQQGSQAGIYTISISAGSLTAVNYAFYCVPGALTITRAVPVISWNPTLTTITHGTQLGSGILDAVVIDGIPGMFRYTTTVNGKQVVLTTTSTLPVGVYGITVTFIPTDQTDYTTATAQVTITSI